ncbi:hypothetical protein KEM54_003898 [Ascosphaera aggregata]|nr:hypothetical protein KEM54_003898 [Ascosphaera aggregata]
MSGSGGPAVPSSTPTAAAARGNGAGTPVLGSSIGVNSGPSLPPIADANNRRESPKSSSISGLSRLPPMSAMGQIGTLPGLSGGFPGLRGRERDEREDGEREQRETETGKELERERERERERGMQVQRIKDSDGDVGMTMDVEGESKIVSAPAARRARSVSGPRVNDAMDTTAATAPASEISSPTATGAMTTTSTTPAGKGPSASTQSASQGQQGIAAQQTPTGSNPLEPPARKMDVDEDYDDDMMDEDGKTMGKNESGMKSPGGTSGARAGEDSEMVDVDTKGGNAGRGTNGSED